MLPKTMLVAKYINDNRNILICKNRKQVLQVSNWALGLWEQRTSGSNRDSQWVKALLSAAQRPQLNYGTSETEKLRHVKENCISVKQLQRRKLTIGRFLIFPLILNMLN